MAPWEWMTPKETSVPSTRWFPSHQPLVTSSGWSSMAQENLSRPCKYLFLLVPQLGRTEIKGIPKCQAAGSQFQSSNYRYGHERVRSGCLVCGDEWGDCGRCASVGYSEVWMRTGNPDSLWECRGKKKDQQNDVYPFSKCLLNTIMTEIWPSRSKWHIGSTPPSHFFKY